MAELHKKRATLNRWVYNSGESAKGKSDTEREREREKGRKGGLASTPASWQSLPLSSIALWLGPGRKNPVPSGYPWSSFGQITQSNLLLAQPKGCKNRSRIKRDGTCCCRALIMTLSCYQRWMVRNYADAYGLENRRNTARRISFYLDMPILGFSFQALGGNR